jgi:acyl CoA:acetate/3-ketoacid CoA transferase
MGYVSKQKDEEFIALYRKLGSPTLVAKELGQNPRTVSNRRASLEIQIPSVINLGIGIPEGKSDKDIILLNKQ